HGCRVATMDEEQPGPWQPAPDGDYLVRTDPAGIKLSTSVEVSCDGTLRYQGPLAVSGGIGVESTVTDQQIDVAMAGARGTPPNRKMVRDTIRFMGGFGAPLGPCQVLYNGPVPGFTPGTRVRGLPASELTVLAMGCTTAHGNTSF